MVGLCTMCGPVGSSLCELFCDDLYVLKERTKHLQMRMYNGIYTPEKVEHAQDLAYKDCNSKAEEVLYKEVGEDTSLFL